MIKIYHNPRCSKSRQALEWLNKKGHAPEVVEYLKSPLSREELEGLVKILDGSPLEMIRKKDAPSGLKLESPDSVVEALVSHPQFMERPIVVAKGRAVVGRPFERIESLLS